MFTRTVLRFSKRANAYSPILGLPSMVSSLILLHPENAAAPMFSTDCGMVMAFNLSQAKNACVPIVFMVFGNMMVSSWWRE